MSHDTDLLAVLLADIAANPEDDDRRRILADWLKDHDDADWGEYIALEIERHCLPDYDPQAIAHKHRTEELFRAGKSRWETRLGLLDIPCQGWAFQSWQRGFPVEVVVADWARFASVAGLVFDRVPVQHLRADLTGPEYDQFLASPWLDRWRRLNLCNHYTPADWPDRGDPQVGHPPEWTDDHLARLVADPRFAAIRELRLSWQQITANGLEHLFRSPYADALTHLDLSSSTWLTGELLRPLLSGSRLGGLQALDLASCPLGETGALALAQSRLPTLRKLSLVSTELTGPGVLQLLANEHWDALEHLDLSNNRLGDDVARFLAESPLLIKLRVLKMPGTDLTDAGLHALAKSPFVSNLRVLDLGYNHFSDATLDALADCGHLETLVDIDLHPSTSSEPYSDAALYRLLQAPHLQRLHRASLVHFWHPRGRLSLSGLRAELSRERERADQYHDLLATVHREPDAAASYDAAATWFEALGDAARAEYIRTIFRTRQVDHRSAECKALLARTAELEAEHMDRWIAQLPELSGITWLREWDNGFPSYFRADDWAAVEDHLPTIVSVSPMPILLLELDRSDVGVMAASPMTSYLQGLCLRCAGDLTEDDLVALLSSPYVSGIRSLRLWNAGDNGARAVARANSLDLSRFYLVDERVTDAGAIALAESPVLARVGWLGLTGNAITDTGALALLRSPYRPAHLMLEGNPLSPEVFAEYLRVYPVR